MTKIPDDFLDLFDRKAFVHLATIQPDGRPQVNPVWCDLEGDLIRINSAEGRLKDRNMRRDPRVTLCLSDPENPYRYLEIQGEVTEITEEGAKEHIDALTKKYMEVDTFPYHDEKETRVIYKVKPTKITHSRT